MQAQEVVARTLVAAGVTQIFGVIGSGNHDVTRSMLAAGANYVAARHEQGATSMADAWTRTTGRVSAVSVHQGCGLTNTVTALTEAAKSRTPLIVLAAETGAAAIHSNFRIRQDQLVESVGAVSLRITAETAARDAALAHRIAVTQQIPVVLNLPLDIQVADAILVEQPAPNTVTGGAAAPEVIASAAEILAGAQRPVLVAGRGALEAGPALSELGERCDALLATSAVARGLFRGSPWELDVSGGFATPLAAELIAEADVVMSFGCALNMWTTRHGTLIGDDATVVQVDTDPLAPGRHRPVDLAVIGDAATVATQLTAELSHHTTASGFRSAEIRHRIATQGRWRQVPYTDGSTAERIDPRTLTIALDDLLDAARTVTVDSGNFMGHPAMMLDIPDVRSLCFTQAFQSVGLGLASAIGAALARPDRLPVLGTGDGGLLMAASELETVVRLGLPLVIVVYNDGAYGAEVHHFGRTDEDEGFITFGDTDFAALARGYGFEALTVRSTDDVAGVAAWIDGPRDHPLLIDAKVVDTEPSWWLAEAFKGH